MVFFLDAFIIPASSSAEMLTSASTHGLLEDFTGDPNAGFDLALAAEWIPIPEITFGLEGSIGKSLSFGGADNPNDVFLRFNPFVRFRMGREYAWGYLKLGSGWKYYPQSSSSSSALVVIGSAGYVVEPVELNIFFGFELFCMADSQTEFGNLTLGLGGLVGYRF